jgi:hypothetical protein
MIDLLHRFVDTRVQDFAAFWLLFFALQARQSRCHAGAAQT